MRWKKFLQTVAMASVLSKIAVVSLAEADQPQPTAIRWASIRWDGESATAKNQEGSTVPLGLDHDLQNTLKRILARARPVSGAATLIDARSGQILAAAEMGHSESGSLLFDPVAPAASLFKIVTTAALFEHSSVTPMTRVCTEGGNRNILREHLSAATGPKARCSRFAHDLGLSRNAAYAQLATKKLLREELLTTAENLGFNAPLHLDGPGTLGTLTVPYNDLAFARTAVGFENSRLSVFGAAQMALTIASNGLVKDMHFQKMAGSSKGSHRAFSERTARRLRDAMEITIHSGTARSSFVNEHGRSTVGPVQVAGKTGTLKPKRGAPTSSWFIGFAPSEHPRVVVSVLLQNPDKWHQLGHQVGRDLLGAYLKTLGVRGVEASR